MFYDVIKALALKEGVKNFRGVPTMYEIRNLPTETRDEKIAVIIKLIQVIEGIGYTRSYRDIKLVKTFNEKLYSQSLSNAIMYASKPNLAIGGLFKALCMLCQDVNHGFNMKTSSKKKLEACFEKGEYDEYFEHRLTQDEKKKLDTRELDGLKDLDWKAMSFLFKGVNGQDISITRRQEANVIKNEDIFFIIKDLEKNEDQQFILDNIEKTISRTRRFVVVDLFISIVFKQTIDKYKRLVEAKKHIEGYKEVEI